MVLPRIFSLGLCALSTLTFAAPWQFVKSEDGIVIDKRPHSEGLVEIRATNANADQLLWFFAVAGRQR